MSYKAIDCQGFAGAFTLGMVQAGFEIIGKRELPGGFASPSALRNTHMTGITRDMYEESPEEEWSVPFESADVVFGNPPCSAFSVMTRKESRGMDSKINDCMWALIEYAIRVDPEFVVFESVGQAYTKGRPLMQELRERLEEGTGAQWDLYHVKHNGFSVGGPSIRPRYFFVAVRGGRPFGIESPQPGTVPMLWDVIGDLHNCELTIEPQVYPDFTQAQPEFDPWWVKEYAIRSEHDVVDGHDIARTPATERLGELAATGEWGFYDVMSVVLKKLWDKGNAIEFASGDSEALWEKWHARDFRMGFTQPVRWHPDWAARVVTGAGMGALIHPYAPRTLTLREIYRLQGFPDDWRLEAAIHDASEGKRDLSAKHCASWPGKGIPVQAGEWIASWVKASLDGVPGAWSGDTIGDREFLIDTKRDWKQYYNERTGELEDSRSAAHIKQMGSRPA